VSTKPGQVQTLASILARTTGGRGAQVIFDTVGGPMFEPALKALGHRGRPVEITSVGDRRVSFDLVNFHLVNFHLLTDLRPTTRWPVEK
jgi:NADPH:quinone reductase-like Zn-dependent oxidoreductase